MDVTGVDFVVSTLAENVRNVRGTARNVRFPNGFVVLIRRINQRSRRNVVAKHPGGVRFSCLRAPYEKE